jgi:hypothetical protein
MVLWFTELPPMKVLLMTLQVGVVRYMECVSAAATLM